MASINRGRRSPFFSETTVLFAVPLIGYLFDYTYEAGFCDFLGIPRSLIAVSISSLIKTSATLLLSYLIVFLFSSLVQGVIGRLQMDLGLPALSRIALRAVYVPLTAAPLYLLAKIYSFDLTPRMLGGYTSQIAFLRELYSQSVTVALLMFVLLIAVWALAAIWTRYRYATAVEPAPIQEVAPSSPQLAVLALILALDGAVLSYVGGLNDASRQVTFLAMRVGSKDAALVRTYGDLFIFKSIQRKPDMLNTDVFLEKLETKPTQFNIVHLNNRAELSLGEQNALSFLVQSPRMVTLVEAFFLPILISLTIKWDVVSPDPELLP